MINCYDYKNNIYNQTREGKPMGADANFAIETYVFSAKGGLARRECAITKGQVVSLLINTGITETHCDNVISQEYYFVDETVGGTSSRTIYYVCKEKFELAKSYRGEVKTFFIRDIKITEPRFGQTRIYVLVDFYHEA
jgi:hypothetical protein